MLSLSARPILFPKPRLRRLLRHRLSSAASALTPPTPRTPTTPAPADPTPLFLRPPTHPVPPASLEAFRRRTAALVPPSAPHLHRHLRWFLADASNPDPSLHLLRAPLDELEALWLAHVRDRRPLQYVVGNEHWGGLVVAVRDGVLIPRPETEAVLEMVGAVEGFRDGWWADLGTGSGAIAVAVARMLGPHGRVFATDVSEVAVQVARLNVQRYGVQDKVEIRHGSWFEPLEEVKGKLTGVISNPPYIPTDDLPGLQPEVGWHEPKLALDGDKWQQTVGVSCRFHKYKVEFFFSQRGGSFRLCRHQTFCKRISQMKRKMWMLMQYSRKPLLFPRNFWPPFEKKRPVQCSGLASARSEQLDFIIPLGKLIACGLSIIIPLEK